MRKLALAALLAAAVAFTPDSMQAQASSDKDQVQAVITKLFDSMRARDTAGLRSIFEPGTRLVGTGNRNGAPVMDVTPIDEFITAIATAAPGQLLDERIETPDIDIADNLASAWMAYKFYVGERFSHCGVDAMHLARTASGWKIVALADTRKPPAQCQ